MARQYSGRVSAPSRIRFIMVDAELGDGGIGQLIPAIENALRGPVSAPVRRLTAASATNAHASHEVGLDGEVQDLQTEDVIDVVPAANRTRGPRKPSPTPDPVPIDMDSDMSLAAFARGKDTKSQDKKYLVAAAWLKDHRGIDAVSAGHIYTCFRTMGWSVGIPDFWQPLRRLKAKKFLTQNDRGEYVIHHLGLDYVKKLGGSNGAG
jgi:hypothetical protein